MQRNKAFCLRKGLSEIQQSFLGSLGPGAMYQLNIPLLGPVTD